MSISILHRIVRKADRLQPPRAVTEAAAAAAPAGAGASAGAVVYLPHRRSAERVHAVVGDVLPLPRFRRRSGGVGVLELALVDALEAAEGGRLRRLPSCGDHGERVFAPVHVGPPVAQVSL